MSQPSINPTFVKSQKILVVEDDHELNSQIAALLETAGYEVDSCFDGEAATLAAARQPYAMILLDILLPKRDGISVLNMVRKFSMVPVIMVTAQGAEEERITGLRQGADDYIAKPFNATELLLRIEALMRRSQDCPAELCDSAKIDNLQLERNSNLVTVDDQPLELTQIQFTVLWELVLNKGEVLSKAYLSQRVLHRALGAYDRSLDMHVSRVRRKLSLTSFRESRLKTVHGKGFCLL